MLNSHQRELMAFTPLTESLEYSNAPTIYSAEHKEWKCSTQICENCFSNRHHGQKTFTTQYVRGHCVAMLRVASIFVRDQRLRRSASDKSHNFRLNLVHCGHCDVFQLCVCRVDANSASTWIQINDNPLAGRTVTPGIRIGDVCSWHYNGYAEQGSNFEECSTISVFWHGGRRMRICKNFPRITECVRIFKTFYQFVSRCVLVASPSTTFTNANALCFGWYLARYAFCCWCWPPTLWISHSARTSRYGGCSSSIFRAICSKAFCLPWPQITFFPFWICAIASTSWVNQWSKYLYIEGR